jgi:hypothetical protein
MRYGTKKPIIYYESKQEITLWADADPRIDITILDPKVKAGDQIRISGTTTYDGTYSVHAVNANVVSIVATWAGGPVANGFGQKCWDMNFDNTLVYYTYDFETAKIVNESPINGFVSCVNLADDGEGRMTAKLIINNMTDAQHGRYIEVVNADTIDMLLHEDDTKGMEFTFVVTKAKDFQGENYPLIDNAIIELISQEYEEIK